MDRLISRACQGEQQIDSVEMTDPADCLKKTDVGDIHSRLFDHRPFLNGELQSFIREFEVKKGIRDVESLLKAGETLTELGSSLDSLQGQHSSILSSFGKSVEEATAAVEALCHQQPPEVIHLHDFRHNQTLMECLVSSMLTCSLSGRPGPTGATRAAPAGLAGLPREEYSPTVGCGQPDSPQGARVPSALRPARAEAQHFIETTPKEQPGKSKKKNLSSWIEWINLKIRVFSYCIALNESFVKLHFSSQGLNRDSRVEVSVSLGLSRILLNRKTG